MIGAGSPTWMLVPAMHVAACLTSGCLCPGGQILCDGQCVEPESHPSHCGACGNTCNDLQRCEGARCVLIPSCGPGAPLAVACDDGNPCNGVYECIDGQCLATTAPPYCDDRITCTRSSCDPTVGSCVHPPDDALCDEGQTCNPSLGCMSPCSYPPCSVVDQCGCAAGHTCAPDDLRSAGTCVVSGGAPVGTPCSIASECEQGLVCLDLRDADRARCSVPCWIDADCGAGRCFSRAVAPLRLTNGEVFSRCEQVCDPVTSFECRSTQGCHLAPLASGDALTYCGEVTASGTAGRSCTELNDCARSHICVGFASGDACARLCHDDGDCSLSTTCRPFATRITLRGENVGYCG